MSAPATARLIPCAKCGAKSGEPCVRLDGKPAARSHGARTPEAPCGTSGGYQRHARANEKPCDECREASRRYMAEYRRKNPARRDADIAGLVARREATRLLIERHEQEFRDLLAAVKAGAA